MSQADDDRSVAERIARELAKEPGRRRGWHEIRALMRDFDIERLSHEARRRMTSALQEAGLTADPPLENVERRDTVVLARIGGNGAFESVGGLPTATQAGLLKDVLTVRTANRGEPVRTVALESLRVPADGSVRWFDVSDTSCVDAAELLELLNPGCGGQLTREMVDDLVSPDPRPKVRLWDSGSVRGVAAFRVTAAESDLGADESRSIAGVLVFEPVEFLVGGDWLITCWHDAEVYRGADRVGERRASSSPSLFAEVERRWSANAVSSAGDLGVLVLFELALTYAPAYRQLYVWEEEWELDFFRRHDRRDHATLSDARACAAILRDWLNPLNPPGMRHDVERAWFPGVTGTPDSGGYQIALRVDDRIDGALKSLREFNQTLRSAYDLLQLREDVFERHRDENFQRNIAVGGSAILIPTLVAGIMGANTWVPGEAGPNSSHWAFVALLCLVLLSGVVAWAVLRWLRDRDDHKP